MKRIFVLSLIILFGVFGCTYQGRAEWRGDVFYPDLVDKDNAGFRDPAASRTAANNRGVSEIVWK